MELTEDQKAVVMLDAGRHLVLAPPGSGKTEMLSQRILRAVRAGMDPSKMLCATFTNRAAFEMRSRIAEHSERSQCPEVGNLHHFCLRFLRSVGLFNPGRHILDEVEQTEFVKEVVDVLREELRSGSLSDRRSHGVTVMGLIGGVVKSGGHEIHAPRVDYVRELLEEYFASCANNDKSPYRGLLSAVLVAHQRRIGIPRHFLRSIPPELYGLDGNGVISALARAYNGLKRKFNSSDFDDLINETYLYLENAGLANDKCFDWVLIDEVQDLNPLQWRIVRAVTSERAVSVYFGDMEQSIFSFLGASGANLVESVRGCERHYLMTNFRATPLLLEVLMRYSLDALRSEWAFLPHPAAVDMANGELLASPLRSQRTVMGNVRHLLESGTAENVAILVRRNADADALEEEVCQMGFRYAKVSGIDLFSLAPMRDFIAFVSVVSGFASRTHWARIIRRFATGVFTAAQSRYFVREMFACGFEPADLWRNSRMIPTFPRIGSRRSMWAWRRRSVLSSLRRTLAVAMRSGVALLDGKPSFRGLFDAFARVAFDGLARYSLHEMCPEGGVPAEKCDAGKRVWATGRVRERVEKFLRYTDFVCRDDTRTLREVLAADWERLGRLCEADLLVGDERIVISTIHKAKGRQFDAVVIPDVEDVLKGMGGAQGEPARLLYVAMSRAKRHLSLFGYPPSRVFQRLLPCFASGYTGYYQRRANGDDLTEDWLHSWEVLAALDSASAYQADAVAEALASYDGPLVRIALKVLRHHPCPEERRARFLELVKHNALPADCQATLVRCFANSCEIDCASLRAVRSLAVGSMREDLWETLLRSFSQVSERPELRDESIAGIAFGLYLPFPELRVMAAQVLHETGDTRWTMGVRGSARDFERLGSVAAPEHDDVIRSILAVVERQSGMTAYSRALRRVLHMRA